MRACWVDAGNDADYTKFKALGITEPIYDLRDPRITKAYLTNVENLGFKPGVYAAWNWMPELDGPEFAEWVSEEVRRLHRSPSIPSVHLNDETHDPERIIAMLTRWRELRPTKKTVWTFEGMQGGLYSPEQAAAINAMNVILGPQCYTGQMVRFESSTIVLDLVTRGFDADLIHPFFDASYLGLEWDGTAYTMGRLPS